MQTVEAFEDDRGRWHCACLCCDVLGPECPTEAGARGAMALVHRSHTTAEIREALRLAHCEE